MKPDVVVAFATDHKFRYYTGVALHTLLEHSSPETRYEILILADSLTSEDRAVFARLVEGRANISLRILEMREKIAELGAENFYIGNYSIANYYRLFLHELLPDYDRVLYLDSDIVVQADVRELFDTDLGDFMLGGVKDRGAALFPLSIRDLEDHIYFKNVMKIERPDRYFNSGVLLMELAKLRNSDFSRKVREEIHSGLPFKLVDQDILNRIFGNRIYYFDETWNHMTRPGDRTAKKKIVHISGVHPWLSIRKPHAALWWSAAEKTYFVQDLKEELHDSPERVRYLEEIEKSYYSILQTTSWRSTAFLRRMSNAVKWFRILIAGIGCKRG